jgi:hypothetical protein
VLSIATNVSENDDARIAATIPHWVRVFGKRLGEIVVVVDMQPRTSRMADSEHRVRSGVDATLATVRRLAEQEPRVKVVLLDNGTDRSAVNRVWFKHGNPKRCQVGSPLFGYIYAIESATHDLVVKMDCDMLVHDAGWVEEAQRALGANEADLVEPRRPGFESLQCSPVVVSTRVFALHKRHFHERLLPMEPHTLGWLRRWHRRLEGRPVWLPLEQMLSEEARAGRLRYRALPSSLGFTLHVPSRSDFLLPEFEHARESVERGVLPESQNWNFAAEHWS